MASPALSHFLPRFGVAAAVAGVLSLTGCQTWNAQDTLPPTSGVQPLKGLAQNVSVRRNAMGMPLIESNSFHDALFALGYVHASDRINQMVTLRLLAQGRLAEMSGSSMLDADRYMRAVNLKKSADEAAAVEDGDGVVPGAEAHRIVMHEVTQHDGVVAAAGRDVVHGVLRLGS